MDKIKFEISRLKISSSYLLLVAFFQADYGSSFKNALKIIDEVSSVIKLQYTSRSQEIDFALMEQQ